MECLGCDRKRQEQEMGPPELKWLKEKSQDLDMVLVSQRKARQLLLAPCHQLGCPHVH